MSKILFLHGLESRPGGTKPKYLASLGHEVFNPVLPKDDFQKSVKIAQASIKENEPDIIVGSSRGGAIAMNVDPMGANLVLIAPAWKRFESFKQLGRDTYILHSTNDEIVPFEDSLLLEEGGASLIECGNNHRMNDPEVLQMLKNVVI